MRYRNARQTRRRKGGRASSRPTPRMNPRGLAPVLLIVGVGLAAQVPRSHAAPPSSREQTLRLRNDLTEGRVSEYRLKRTVRQTTRGDGPARTVTYGQTADWIRFHFGESKPGELRIAQMMLDYPARALAMYQGERAMTPAEVAAADLPVGSVRLATERMTGTDGPVQVPAVDPALEAVMAALLDVAHWPDGRKRKGDRWERDLAWPGLQGTQTIELINVVRHEDHTRVTLRVTVAGEFTGRLRAAGFHFAAGKALVFWSSTERVLRTLKGEASFTCAGQSPRETDLKLDLQLVRSVVLADAEADEVRSQLVDFGRAWDAFRTGQTDAVRELCETFRRRWPDSRWSAATDYLEKRPAPRAENDTSAEADLVRQALASLVARWQAAASGTDEAALKPVRSAYERVLRERRPAIVRLASAADENTRSIAVFALAFGDPSDDAGIVVQAARDGSPRVRAWAIYALAVRGVRDVDVSLLMDRLNDADGNVRARACQAVAACVSMDSTAMPKLRARIADVLRSDRFDAARYRAAEALALIGGKDELALLRRAVKHETERPMREHLERMAIRLSKRLDARH